MPEKAEAENSRNTEQISHENTDIKQSSLILRHAQITIADIKDIKLIRCVNIFTGWSRENRTNFNAL